MNHDSTTNWSEKYNALPIEVRIIGSAMESKMRIQQLRAEKHRLAAAYRRSMKEINDHIKNCQEHLSRLDKKTL